MAQSRNEEILEATLNHQEYDKPPQSREEELLIELKEAIDQGGGGGTITIDPTPTQGSTNAVASGGTYTALSGKQDAIDSSHKLDADLVDDTNSTHKFISAYDDLSGLPSINGVTLTGNKTSDDLDLTGLWIGTTAEYTQEASTIPAGTLVIKTDETGIDSTPTENSTNPVTSGGVYTALDNKVDKVQGKGLSTNDYTNIEKVKLAIIDSIIDDVPTFESTHPVSSGGVYDALGNKVDKVSGKGLSTEDFTAMYKAWLDVSMQSPLNHNGIFRGKDLTNVYTVDELYSMIHSGNFDDLFLGDYINVSITTTLPDETVKTETVSLMIAAFDYYYNIGDTALTTHHIVLIPRGYGFATTAKMNETNTTTGGYLNSYMHQTVLPCYADSLRTALNNHLLSHRTILSNAVHTSTASMAGAGITGAASGWEWTTVELQLMTEVQVYGTTVWSSSAYDVGVDNRQLPVFKFINPVHLGRNSFWLRSVVSSTGFAYCLYGGYAGTGGASDALYVCPQILFG